MVIYATEFVLWCGVFACGGYFNLMPWARQKISGRFQRKQAERAQNATAIQAENEAGGASNDISLHENPSSTSVFRTPSSLTTPRSSVWSLGRVSE